MTTKISDVIVLLPGILGSVLKKNDECLWDVSPGVLGGTLLSGGADLTNKLILDSPSDSGQGVTAAGLIQDVHLLPGLWKIDGYTAVAKAIRDCFEVEPGRNYFEFPYDWRLDNRISAQRLKASAEVWLDQWRNDKKNPEAKLILIAHSMGGLVSRYFLEVLEGWKDTRSLITFGTPYRGSVKALDFLSNGIHKRLGPLTLINLTQLVRSLPSAYQLLPIYQCYDPGDGQLRYINEVEIPNLNRDLVSAGLEFNREIEERVDMHLKDESYLDSRYRIYPIVGIKQPTLQSVELVHDKLIALDTYDGEELSGDGTVPRVSATPIELSKAGNEMFVSTPHSGIQNAKAVQTQLTGLLEGVDLSGFKAAGALSSINLSIDDFFSINEPITLRLRSEEEYDLTVEITDVAKDTIVTKTELLDGHSDWQQLELERMKAGVYRVSVNGGRETQPVTDIFAVLDVD